MLLFLASGLAGIYLSWPFGAAKFKQLYVYIMFLICASARIFYQIICSERRRRRIYLAAFSPKHQSSRQKRNKWFSCFLRFVVFNFVNCIGINKDKLQTLNAAHLTFIIYLFFSSFFPLSILCPLFL